jgi:putative Mn2+ efflux pump MntP
MVLAFGAFDGVASLAGLVAGGLIVGALEPRARVIGAMLLAIYGLWLAVEPFERTLGAQLWVPAVLSVDNFGAGVALAGSWPAFAVAALLGVTSAALATLGFWAGGLVRARVPEPAARVSGVLLLAIAVSQAMNVG